MLILNSQNEIKKKFPENIFQHKLFMENNLNTFLKNIMYMYNVFFYNAPLC